MGRLFFVDVERMRGKIICCKLMLPFPHSFLSRHLKSQNLYFTIYILI